MPRTVNDIRKDIFELELNIDALNDQLVALLNTIDNSRKNKITSKIVSTRNHILVLVQELEHV